jgi:hypothetical protein
MNIVSGVVASFVANYIDSNQCQSMLVSMLQLQRALDLPDIYLFVAGDIPATHDVQVTREFMFVQL